MVQIQRLNVSLSQGCRGQIKRNHEQIVALASIPKEERPAILEELKKKKSDRDDTVLERLKPNRPPPKPKPAPQKKKADGNGKQHGVAGRTAGNVGTGTDLRVPAGSRNFEAKNCSSGKIIATPPCCYCMRGTGGFEQEKHVFH